MLMPSVLSILILAAQPNASWRLVQSPKEAPPGVAGLAPCAVVSPISPLSKEYPEDGGLLLVVQGDALFLTGSNISMYFNGVLDVVAKVGATSQKIGARTPVEAPAFVAKMAAAGSTRVYALIRFKEETYTHTFTLAGFRAARAASRKCLAAAPPRR